MHPQITLIVAQQHIADLHRAADHNRLVHTAGSATSSHAVPAPRHAAAAPVTLIRRLRRRLVLRPCPDLRANNLRNNREVSVQNYDIRYDDTYGQLARDCPRNCVGTNERDVHAYYDEKQDHSEEQQPCVGARPDD